MQAPDDTLESVLLTLASILILHYTDSQIKSCAQIRSHQENFGSLAPSSSSPSSSAAQNSHSSLNGTCAN